MVHNMLSNLSINKKLGVILIAALLPSLFLVFLFTKEVISDIDFSKKERDGITFLKKITPLAKDLMY